MSNQSVPLAIVHHANQFLITNGYANRPGIEEILGPTDASAGLRAVFHLHSQYEIPFHLHISGTFIEACAWYDPLFLEEITELREAGLIEIIGSTYSQNIMPLFDSEHNRSQILEELYLINKWLGGDVSAVKGFWIPERVWNTRKLAKLLRDIRLPNGGFQYTLLDDRLLLPDKLRGKYDSSPHFMPELFEAYEIEGGEGLIALPISQEVRLSIPFETDMHEKRLNHLMSQICREVVNGRDVIAIYGDDMEKVAGIPPWNPKAIEHYEHFLKWLDDKKEISPVLLQSWLSSHNVQPPRSIHSGTYVELEKEFGAGHDYLNWVNSPAWAPYQSKINEIWKEIKSFSVSNTQYSSLLELARKHALACTYETAWHDAPNSIHTDPDSKVGIALPAPWARAVASHVRASSVLLSAVNWENERKKSRILHAYVGDLDGDGHEEVVLRNNEIAVIISPRFGGRIVYLFSFVEEGKLIIGNPTDDWNWLEELNDYMDIPMNHPGALADYGFEHDQYEILSLKETENQEVALTLLNKEVKSAAFGMTKTFLIKNGRSEVKIQYEHIPSNILPLSLDIGLSPDYLRLLREGRSNLVPYKNKNKKGFQNGSVISWVSPDSENTSWRMSRNPIFGHGYCLGLSIKASEGSLCIGVESTNKKGVTYKE